MTYVSIEIYEQNPSDVMGQRPLVRVHGDTVEGALSNLKHQAAIEAKNLRERAVLTELSAVGAK